MKAQSVKIDYALWEKVGEIARKERRSKKAVIELAVEAYLGFTLTRKQGYGQKVPGGLN